MGGLLAFMALQITTTLKRHAVIYGLMALGGLVTIFAVGYVLDAVRTALMFRYGAVLASLFVAAGLIVAAGCLVTAAIVVGNRAPANAPVSRFRAVPYLRSYSPAALTAAAAAAAGALTAAVIIVRSAAVRAFLASRP